MRCDSKQQHNPNFHAAWKPEGDPPPETNFGQSQRQAEQDNCKPAGLQTEQAAVYTGSWANDTGYLPAQQWGPQDFHTTEQQAPVNANHAGTAQVQGSWFDGDLWAQDDTCHQARNGADSKPWYGTDCGQRTYQGERSNPKQPGMSDFSGGPSLERIPPLPQAPISPLHIARQSPQQPVWIDTAQWKGWVQDPNPTPKPEYHSNEWLAQGAALCETWGATANSAAAELLQNLDRQTQQVPGAGAPTGTAKPSVQYQMGTEHQQFPQPSSPMQFNYAQHSFYNTPGPHREAYGDQSPEEWKACRDRWEAQGHAAAESLRQWRNSGQRMPGTGLPTGTEQQAYSPMQFRQETSEGPSQRRRDSTRFHMEP